MVLLTLWTTAFISCMWPLTSCAEGTVETALIDPFDIGRAETSASQETKEWLDPFDMTRYSHAEKRMVNKYHSTKGSKDCQCESNEMEKNFLQRLVNLFVNQCQNEGAVEDISILLTVTSNQLRELSRLKDAADSEATVRLLNGIFSYMTIDAKSSFTLDIFNSEEVWSNIAAMSFALLPFCVFVTGGTLRRIVLILALAVFAVSYFKTQKLLLKQQELQNEHILMKATECGPRRWSWFNFFGSNNDEAECLKQLHAQRIDPSLEVTPMQVISHMTVVGILQPVEHFGIMFSRFSNKIFESHSMLYGLIVFAIATLILVYFATACCAAVFGRNITVGNRYISLGMTGSAEKQHAPVEATPQSQVSTKPNTEMSVVNYDHHPQPVIQIIHNYPIKHVDEPAVRNDYQIKQATSEENISNNSELKAVDSVEESHKICEVSPGSSSTKQETSKNRKSKDIQK